jgi:2-amino-4-hydroxy-6-hydroxymethyldihydropteridine diphosphokinase
VKAGQRQYLLGLGSNLGDRAYYIEQAVTALAALPESKILAISEAFDSDPVGYKEQDTFLNICLSITCGFNPEELLAACLSIETKLGRIRTIKDGPRTIDIDVLFYEGGAVELPDLTLPHPRWQVRGFVVFPLRHLLQAPALAKDDRWDWLRAKVASLPVDGSGLRPWQGPTPWIKPTR